MKSKLSQLGFFAVAVAAFVVLSVTSHDTGGLVSLVGPILSGVFVVSRLDQRSDTQDQALTQITHQTNGVLSQRIKDAVSEALAEKTRVEPLNAPPYQAP